MFINKKLPVWLLLLFFFFALFGFQSRPYSNPLFVCKLLAPRVHYYEYRLFFYRCYVFCSSQLTSQKSLRLIPIDFAMLPTNSLMKTSTSSNEMMEKLRVSRLHGCNLFLFLFALFTPQFSEI